MRTLGVLGVLCVKIKTHRDYQQNQSPDIRWAACMLATVSKATEISLKAPIKEGFRDGGKFPSLIVGFGPDCRSFAGSTLRLRSQSSEVCDPSPQFVFRRKISSTLLDRTAQ